MTRRRIIIEIAAALVIAFTACDRRSEENVLLSRRRYHAVVRETMRLYTRLHPLRSSRLALPGADSLLFTYSDREIDEANRAVSRLMETISDIRPAYLEEGEVDNLTLIVHWLKGERFAFSELALHRRNPLIYCIVAEEALFGIPTRFGPPCPGEREAYEARIAGLPLLFSNAERLLENPPEPHVQLAVERTAALRASLDTLKISIERRYGEAVDGLDRVQGSLESFHRFLTRDLARRAHGSVITGAENLSLIFLYDESLTIDPAWIDREAERTIERLKRRAESIRRRIDAAARIASSGAPASTPFDSIPLSLGATGGPKGEASRASGSISPPGGRTLHPAAAAYDAAILHDIEAFDKAAVGADRIPDRHAPGSVIVRADDGAPRLPANPRLTIPREERALIYSIQPSPFTDRPCRETILHRAHNRTFDRNDYAYALLGALSSVREGELLVCRAADTIRTILSGETYREGWKRLAVENLIDRFNERRSELELRFIEESVESLAMMKVVMHLHAGTLAADSAVAYLMNTTGLSPDEARSAYLRASVSPTIAYRGLVILLIDDFLKSGELNRGAGRPRRLLRELMREHPGLPLSLIRDKVRE